MAPSNKLIALLVALAVIVPSSLPSTAARELGAAKDDAAAAPAPSAASGGEALHPMGLFDDIGDVIGDIIHFRLPDLPLPAILPCPPDFPIKIPFIPCHNVTKPVTECRSSLAKYMPACAGFLTGGNGSASSPPSKCCDAITPFFDDKSTTPLCLCHVVNGDLDELLPKPMNRTRANSFLQQCGFELTSDKVSMICANENDVLDIPPMDAPSPPPTDDGEDD
ncbi:unnamed protein product [Urochloa decumbens]|uniref:Bifunctional inhibitor/plant lipid transfer protein/seed storage helical domain-containing protein n=1 Tax=Urochloa decumbens TaxID=240449 RepID=A0ABC9BIG1_9POAL